MNIKITCKCGATFEGEAELGFIDGWTRSNEIDIVNETAKKFQERHKCIEIVCDEPATTEDKDQ